MSDMSFTGEVSLNLRYVDAESICYGLNDSEPYSKVRRYAGRVSNPELFVSIAVGVFCPQHAGALPR